MKKYYSGRALALGLLSVLSACGGGGGDAAPVPVTPTSGTVVTQTVVLNLTQIQQSVTPQLSAPLKSRIALPLFHVAPVLLKEPVRTATMSSKRAAPTVTGISSQRHEMITRGLTLSGIQKIVDANGSVNPLTLVTTYNPAQIRAAYAMSALPSTQSSLSSTQSYALGAGQTIYIIDANDDPNAAQELAAFNAKFSLPGCTTVATSPTTSLPLPAAKTSGCQFSVVYSSSSSASISSVQPAYDSGWATEIALDVQWTHATAPYARIVLIEAQDATTQSLMYAVSLANAMGPGVVSMSFGASETSDESDYDSLFQGTGMSYVAAAGDSGTGVEWPSVSPYVLGVGGTSLTYSGSANRSEVTWSGTGGGVSAYVTSPPYQAAFSGQSQRAVSDVSFNGDPYTGQYVAVMSQSGGTPSWLSVGGTSLSTPQWAGILAVANAQRMQSGLSMLGQPHQALYQGVAGNAGTYSTDILDVTLGNDGNCGLCAARPGYDEVTGLGTPNIDAVLFTLSSYTPPSSPSSSPVMVSTVIDGQVGTSVSYQLVSTGAGSDQVSYSATGLPSGALLSASGLVSWPVPAAGVYTLQVMVTDVVTGKSSTGAVTMTILSSSSSGSGGTGGGTGGITAPPPTVSSEILKGSAGAAFTAALTVSSLDSFVLTMHGAPSGLLISQQGVLSWASPVAGSYAVTVLATDSVTGSSTEGLELINIIPAATVVTVGGSIAIQAAPISGVQGSAVTAKITLTDASASAMTVTISNAPVDMVFSTNGFTITATWANPVTTSLVLTVAAVDSNGIKTTTTLPLTIH